MTNFILMLTRNDVTVPNAVEIFKEIRDIGVRFIGLKDVGLPHREMRTLVSLMRKEGKIIFLEVVSENKDEAMRSVENAIALDVDYLIGGTYIEQTLRLLKGKIRFMPYIGKVLGHPCILRGSLQEIVDDAKRAEHLGVDGINLLAYRYEGDADRLMSTVKSAIDMPIIVAGSVNGFERIRKVTELGMWGLTIGTAIFEEKFVLGGDLRDQITAVLRELKKSKKQR